MYPPVPDDSLPGQPEEQRDESRAEHETVMDEMSSAAPADPTELAIDHDKILDELSGSMAEPEDTPVGDVTRVPDLGELASEPRPKDPTLRHYVPPQERTPANREDRRAEHERIMAALRKPESSFAPDFSHAEDDDADADGSFHSGMKDFLEADTRHKDTVASMLTDSVRRIEDATTALERARL